MLGVFHTEHLLLRPAVAEDIEPIARASGATNTERITALVENNSAWWRVHGYGVWVVLDPTTREPLGWCGLRPGSTPLEPELMYGLTPSVRGRGLATEAARAVLAFAFSTPHVQSVWAATDLNNVASVGVMERIGMVFERRGELDGMESLIYRVRKATANNAFERTRDG